MINFDEIEKIKTDLIVGFGSTCRVAQALKRNGLRYFSNPFDWQMSYDLNVVINLLKNKGENFYSEFFENKNYSKAKTRGIQDKNTGMISMHDIPIDLPIEKIPNYFKEIYKPRFERLDNFLKKAENPCIITCRNIDLKEIKIFVKEFLKLYNFNSLYYINIFDIKDERIEIIKEKNITYFQYYFNDEHKNGRNKSNPDFWLGNIEYWDKILSKINVSNQHFF